jgi:hypothetical protein
MRCNAWCGITQVKYAHVAICVRTRGNIHLAPEFFFKNFSTPCTSNVNITGTEKGSIMK